MLTLSGLAAFFEHFGIEDRYSLFPILHWISYWRWLQLYFDWPACFWRVLRA